MASKKSDRLQMAALTAVGVGIVAVGVVGVGAAVIGKLWHREFLAFAVQAGLAFAIGWWGLGVLRDLHGRPRRRRSAAVSNTARSTPRPAPQVVVYSEAALQVLDSAAARAPDRVVRRSALAEALRRLDVDGIWDRWDLDNSARRVVYGADSSEVARLQVNASAGGPTLAVSATMQRVLQRAEALARTYGMPYVHPGHLAAANIFTSTGDDEATADVLSRYFDGTFDGVADVLIASPTDWAAPGAPQAGGTRPERPRAVDAAGWGVKRWVYAVGALLFLVPCINVLAKIPTVVSGSHRLRSASALVAAGEPDDAAVLYRRVYEQWPDSINALVGLACTALLRGDLDGWALYSQVAMSEGLRPTLLRPCTALPRSTSFVVRRASGVIVLAHRDGTSESPVTVEAAGHERWHEYVEASCVNGAAGLPRLGYLHAFVGLGLAQESADAAQRARTRLAACATAWPASQQRANLLGMLGAAS